MQEIYRQKLENVMGRLDAPFFFYDLDQLRSHLEEINKVLDPDIKLWYACKANPMSGVIKVLRNLGYGIDVASRGELLQVLNTGIDPKNVLATGPGKSKDYLRHFLKSGVRIIILESINQANWLNQVASEMNIKVDALLRVQLVWHEGKSVLGGDAITPFGLSGDDWQELDIASLTHLNLKGFHVFQWGNILDVNRLEKIWDFSIAEIKSISEKLNIPCEIMDLGGGLGIPYAQSDKAISFKDVHALLMKLKQKYSLGKIWMELGRFTVGECGYYLTKVIDKKTVRGKQMLVTEGGINHIARVALTSQAFPCQMFRKSNAETVSTIVHGPLCTALDNLGTFELPSDIEIGDWLVFGKAGAYGFTESMPYFLCHSLAGEVIYYNGDMMIPRPPRESFEWLI